MALRDSIYIFGGEADGAVDTGGDYDERVWFEKNELLEYDYFRETIEVLRSQWFGCTKSAAIAAFDEVMELEGTETIDNTYVSSASYRLENRKTNPRSYVFEYVTEERYRYKNGSLMTEDA